MWKDVVSRSLGLTTYRWGPEWENIKSCLDANRGRSTVVQRSLTPPRRLLGSTPGLGVPVTVPSGGSVGVSCATLPFLWFEPQVYTP